MPSRQAGAVLFGIEAHGVEVEVDLSAGLPGIHIAGLPDSAIRESCLRVRAALRNSGFPIPNGRITVNLAPAGLRKEGTALDLPIAAAILATAEPFPAERGGRLLLAGELALDGELRPVRGALSMAILAKRSRLAGFVLPRDSAAEAAAIGGLAVFPVRTLAEAIELLRAAEPVAAGIPAPAPTPDRAAPALDFRDVRGQAHARRAIEIASAGGHHLLFVGPPGSGKTMLARRIPTVLPPLSEEEAIEVTRIHSVSSGGAAGGGLFRRRPFRAPHHTISAAGLVGGGASPKPGEASLAHGGVLFLDELPEFRRQALEVLRQPLEEGRIRIMRSMRSTEFPARFLLAAAMNPCHCGFHGDRDRPCRCTPPEVWRYRGRVSGPLLDRIDLHVEVPRVAFADLVGPGGGEPSAAIRERVGQARRRQEERWRRARIRTNAEMTARQLRRHCPLAGAERDLVERAVSRLGLSARAVDRVRKVARTIADLAGRDTVRAGDLAEAIQYRSFDRK